MISRNNKTVLILTDFFLPGKNAGGPIRSVSHIVERLQTSFELTILTRNRDLGSPHEYSISEIEKVKKRFKAKMIFSNFFSYFFHVVSNIIFKKYDVIYLNSFFSSLYSIFPLILARAVNRNVLLSARGELSYGAIKNSSQSKKILYIKFFKIFRLQKFVTFQVSSDKEKEDLLTIFCDADNIVVCSNIGVKANPSIEVSNDILNIVYLGRISKIKNIDFIIRTLSHIKNDVVLNIFGPIEDDQYWENCQALCNSLSERVRINYFGAIEHHEVRAILTNNDLLFYPSSSENFGHVIFESLSVGTPVLISNGTPWADLETKGLGFNFDLTNMESFVTVIQKFSQYSKLEKIASRKKVVSYITENDLNEDAVNAQREAFRTL